MKVITAKPTAPIAISIGVKLNVANATDAKMPDINNIDIPAIPSAPKFLTPAFLSLLSISNTISLDAFLIFGFETTVVANINENKSSLVPLRLENFFPASFLISLNAEANLSLIFDEIV